MGTELQAVELPQERRQQILEKLWREGKVIAADLSAFFGVSEDTIRRDLRELAQAGLLQRVHGGALPPSPSAAAFTTRSQKITPTRTRLAAAAAKLIQEGQVVIFDGGTTTLEVARQLRSTLAATAVTTSPQVAVALANYPHLEVILIGGRLDKEALVTVGGTALDSLRMIQADLCLFGVCSLHPNIGLTTTNYEELPLKRAMIEGSGDVVAVVTADKFGTAAPYVVAPIRRLTHIVTEASLPPEVLLPYRVAKIEIIQVESDKG
jgi:DeoR/GlpR family transcriptional regulator of sugar metabolism